MCYFVFLFFSGICSYVHFLITNYCSFVFTVYTGGVCTGIFIPGFGSTRTYETLNFIRHELSLLSCLTKVLRPNKLPASIKKEPRAIQSLPWTLQIKFSTNLSHIDNKLGAFKSNFSPQDDSPDSESKRFKIQIETKKLKFKGNEKQFLFNAGIEDYSSFALDTIKKGDFSRAQKCLEMSLDLIRKRQRLIKLGDKSGAAWLVPILPARTPEPDSSEDYEIKRECKKRRRTRVERNARWLLPSRRPVWTRVQALLLLLLAIVMIGSFFEVNMCVSPF